LKILTQIVFFNLDLNLLKLTWKITMNIIQKNSIFFCQDCQDQLSISYLSVLQCGDYGASRILELCENEDLKVRDTATLLLCKLSGKDFFRCKFRAGGVSILMNKIDIYPKNSRSKICYSTPMWVLCIFKSIGH
jgi:hypothetical protein